MAFNWQEFLSLAELLLQTESEAAHRSAISRAYYSVYNAALERVHSNNRELAPDIDGGLHKKCWALYQQSPDPSCRQLGIDGSRLCRLRVRADYKKGDFCHLKEQATAFVSEVKVFRSKLAALDPRHP